MAADQMTTLALSEVVMKGKLLPAVGRTLSQMVSVCLVAGDQW